MKKKVLLKNNNRQSVYDRRMLSYVTYSPERRSGHDRRFSGYKLFALTENVRLSYQGWLKFMTFSDNLWTFRNVAMANCIILVSESRKVMLANFLLQALNKFLKDRWSTLVKALALGIFKTEPHDYTNLKTGKPGQSVQTMFNNNGILHITKQKLTDQVPQRLYFFDFDKKVNNKEPELAWSW